jgi:hypothetical protein
MRPRPSIVRIPTLAIIAAALLATTLAGCDLMVAQVTPRPSRLVATEPPFEPEPSELDEVPTIRPEPSGDGPDLVEAANALADLRSYRVTVETRGLVPATPPDGKVTMTSTLVQGEDPAAKFTMTGVDGFAGGRLEAVVIGDRAWLKEGAGRWLPSPGGAADFDAAFTTLSPIDLVNGFEGLTAAIQPMGSEKRNGQKTLRYHTESGDAAAIAAGLTSGGADAWLSADKGYLVGLVVDGTWDLDGTPTPIRLRIEVTKVNDRANTVVPPG